MIIYKATCVITGKSYIGQTRLTLKERKRHHDKCKSDCHFHRVIRKYGKDSALRTLQVVDHETGIVYGSITEVANALCVKPSLMFWRLRKSKYYRRCEIVGEIRNG